MLPVLSVRSSDEGGDDKERLFCFEAAYEPGWCHSFQQDSALGIDEPWALCSRSCARACLLLQMRSGFRGSVLGVRV